MPNSSEPKSSQKFTKELLEKFISSRPDGCSKRTIEFYRYTVTNFIGYPLCPDGVNAYLKSLNCGNGKARFYQALKTLFLWLYHNNYTQDRIIDKVPKPKIQRKLLPVVSKEQLDSLLVDAVKTGQAIGEMRQMVKKGEDSEKSLRDFIREMRGRSEEN